MKNIFWKLRYAVVMLLLGSVCTFAGCGQAMEGPGAASSGGNSVGDSLEARTEKVLASLERSLNVPYTVHEPDGEGRPDGDVRLLWDGCQ